MTLKSRGSIAIDPWAKLKERKDFMNKGPIAKCQNFRGENKDSQFSRRNDVIPETKTDKRGDEKKKNRDKGRRRGETGEKKDGENSKDDIGRERDQKRKKKKKQRKGHIERANKHKKTKKP
jgi:hypothetical protein